MADNNYNNPDGNPNPNIAEYGKDTRFGAPGGPDPKAAQKKSREKLWSVRDQLRRIAAHEFEPGAKLTPDDLAGIFKSPNGKLTGAQLLAMAKFQQGMKNFKAMENVTNDIDGKLIEKQKVATVTLAELVEGSYKDGDDDAEREE